MLNLTQPPKTTWQEGEVFTLADDYQRICTNLQAVHTFALPLYPSAMLPALPQLTEGAWTMQSDCNTLEQAVNTLVATTVPENGYQPRVFAANSRIWSAADINRIEGITQTLARQLSTQAKARPRLAFILKGSDF